MLVIRAAKEKGIQVTCEVSPHHLFLTEDDAERIGIKRSGVKPPLVTIEDQKALWDNLDVIDCFATDHGKLIACRQNSICVLWPSRDFTIRRRDGSENVA